MFKKENPDRKIGFSTFALLRPKWCIPVGAACTHNVCVCIYHQNVKLMLAAMNSSHHYRQIMEMCVCDVDNYDCMMGHFDDCLDPSVLKSFLRNELLKTVDPDGTIQFNQWVSTNRSQLVEEESKFDNFIENLVGKFGKLTEHHYVAKKQVEFFKQLKENIQFEECVVMLDFAENYSFLVQDAAQGFHWNNSWATIQPFVIYYVDGSGKLAHKSYVYISDHKTHDTIMVYSFLKHFYEHYVSNKFPFLHKVFYFSNGSAAQYKNFKNLTNLIFHQNNFHILAE